MALWMAAAALWGVLQLLLLSWPVRSVGWPMVLLAFGVGAYGCGVFTVLVELFVARQLASADGTTIQGALETVTWTTAPPVEELIKIAPLLLAAWAMRGRVQWGLTDFVVLGGAVGTGFALLESVLQYAFAPNARITASPTGQGWTVASSLSPPFVSGFPEFLGHWFPSSVGKLELGTHAVTVPVERHVTWSVLGGLAVGLWVCARRWWVRTAGLVPLLLAIGQHGVTNYVAAKPEARQGAVMEWYDRIEASGLWTVGACLALATVWDLRRRHRGKLREQELASRESGHERAISLPAERAGHDAVSALAAYGLLRLPWTWLIALRYARRRRALFYVSAHPRSHPEPLTALRDEIAVQSSQLDATGGAEAWRGLSLRQAWKQTRSGSTWPWWEKLILIVGLVLMIPSCVLAAGYASGWGEDLEAYFANGANGASATSGTAGPGWTLLIACGAAGLLLAALRLVLTLRGLPRTRALAPAEPYAAGLLRVAVLGGAVLAGVLLLTRAGTIAENGTVIDPLATSFLLEKFLEIAPYLLIALLMFAGPAALPLEMALGGSLLTELLGMAAGRMLAPVVARAGARLAARGLITAARTNRFDLFPDAGNIRWGDDIVRTTSRGAKYKIPRTDGLHRLINPEGGRANCRACVLATENTLRGYPSSAIPRIPAGPISDLERHFPGRSFKPTNLANIVDHMKISGDGSRAIVYGGHRRGGIGHVFNVINRKGDIIFLDGQTGQASHVAQWGSYQIMKVN